MKTPVLNPRFETHWGRTCMHAMVTDCDDMNAGLFFDARAYANRIGASFLKFHNNQIWQLRTDATEKLRELMGEAFLLMARRLKPDATLEDLDYSDASFILIRPPGQAGLYPHIHFGITLNLIYYVNVLPGQGILRLWNPKLMKHECIEIQPFNGYLFVQPGDLPHDVVPFHGTEDRLCAVSNCMVRGIRPHRNTKLTSYDEKPVSR